MVLKWSKTRLRKGKRLVHYILLCDSTRERIEEVLNTFASPIWVEKFKEWLDEEERVKIYEEFESVGKGKMSYAISTERDTVFYENKEVMEWFIKRGDQKWPLRDGQPFFWSVVAYEDVCGSKKICEERVRCAFIDIPPDPTFRAYK